MRKQILELFLILRFLFTYTILQLLQFLIHCLGEFICFVIFLAILNIFFAKLRMIWLCMNLINVLYEWYVFFPNKYRQSFFFSLSRKLIFIYKIAYKYMDKEMLKKIISAYIRSEHEYISPVWSLHDEKVYWRVKKNAS